MTDEKPIEQLQPGSWTEAEVDAMEGRRVRFRTGGEGTVKNAAGLVNGKVIYAYAVEVTPDAGPTILLSKGDSEQGDWAFDVLPGPRVSEEERAALPEWGTGTADDSPDE